MTKASSDLDAPLVLIAMPPVTPEEFTIFAIEPEERDIVAPVLGSCNVMHEAPMRLLLPR